MGDASWVVRTIIVVLRRGVSSDASNVVRDGPWPRRHKGVEALPEDVGGVHEGEEKGQPTAMCMCLSVCLFVCLADCCIYRRAAIVVVVEFVVGSGSRAVVFEGSSWV